MDSEGGRRLPDSAASSSSSSSSCSSFDRECRAFGFLLKACLSAAPCRGCGCTCREAFGWWCSRSLQLLTRRGRTRRAAAVYPKMARPPILSVALPSDTGRVLSIQSHTVQVHRRCPASASACLPQSCHPSVSWDPACSLPSMAR